MIYLKRSLKLMMNGKIDLKILKNFIRNIEINIIKESAKKFDKEIKTNKIKILKKKLIDQFTNDIKSKKHSIEQKSINVLKDFIEIIEEIKMTRIEKSLEGLIKQKINDKPIVVKIKDTVKNFINMITNIDDGIMENYIDMMIDLEEEGLSKQITIIKESVKEFIEKIET